MPILLIIAMRGARLSARPDVPVLDLVFFRVEVFLFAVGDGLFSQSS